MAYEKNENSKQGRDAFKHEKIARNRGHQQSLPSVRFDITLAQRRVLVGIKPDKGTGPSFKLATTSKKPNSRCNGDRDNMLIHTRSYRRISGDVCVTCTKLACRNVYPKTRHRLGLVLWIMMWKVVEENVIQAVLDSKVLEFIRSKREKSRRTQAVSMRSPSLYIGFCRRMRATSAR